MISSRRLQDTMIVCLLVMAAPVAASEGGGVGGFSLFGSFLQMVASLAVVIGVILLFSHFGNRLLKNGPNAGVNRYIRVIETRHIGPKKSLMLVEIGGQYLLLGNSAEGVQLIKQVEMLEEIEVVGAAESAWHQAVPVETLRGMLAKVPRDFLRPIAARKSC